MSKPNRYFHLKHVERVEVRKFAPHDAPAVVDLLYKTYGYTYRGIPGAYDPDALASRLAEPGALGLVSIDVTGRVSGFVAVRPIGPREVEVDALAVDPETRQSNVGHRLAAAVFEYARGNVRKLVASVVTRHPFAQRNVLAQHVLPCALEPGVHPPDLAFRGFAGGQEPQRETFLYSVLFFERERHAIYVPPRHEAIIREIGRIHGLQRDPRDPARADVRAVSEIAVSLREAWLSAVIDVRHVGSDLAERIAAIKKDLEEGFIEHIELRLPLSEPVLDLERLEGLGFFFSGIDPAVDGADVLRLTALRKPIDFGRVHLDPLAEPLGRYVEACARAVGASRPAAAKRSERPVGESLAPERQIETVRRLSAGLSHEINNPLNIIVGTIYKLRERLRDAKSVEVEAHLRSIEEEVARIADLLDKLRRFAHPDEAAIGPFDLGRALEDTAQLVEGLYRSRAVALVRRFANDLPAVRGHGPTLQHAFIEVLLNALEASPAGAEVTIELRHESAQALVLVSDKGPGIAPEHLPHVFDPFFTTKEPGGGPGLGLAVARSIVEAQGGKIEIESKPKEGTTVRVRLSLAEAGEKVSHGKEGGHLPAQKPPRAGDKRGVS
jgi:signal transduction histidine kinase